MPNNTSASLCKMLQLKNDGYVSIPHNAKYNFGEGAFSVMAYITPKKTENGSTVLTEGTIVSSKPVSGGGGWQLFLKEEHGLLKLCFKTDSGRGYKLLQAPLYNLYDDKVRYGDRDRVKDLEESNKLFKEYSHLVAAVREANGTMSIYLNGYLLARATPDSNPSTNNYELTGFFKESAEKPNRFFTIKCEGTNYSVGSCAWDPDAFESIGSSFTLSSSPSHNETDLTDAEKSDNGITSIVSKIERYTPVPNTTKGKRLSLSVKTAMFTKGLVLAEFTSRTSVNTANVDNNTGVSIGRIEQYAHFYEGFVKDVSLWKTALSQKAIIRCIGNNNGNSGHADCVGFWKLENDYADDTSTKNSGEKNGDIQFVDADIVLPIYVEDQEPAWCWAAASLAIIEYYNPGAQLTQQDVQQIGKNSSFEFFIRNTKYFKAPIYARCKRTPPATLGATQEDYTKFLNALNEIGDKAQAKNFTSKFIYGNDYTNEITFDFLRKEINNGKPVMLSVKWTKKVNGKISFSSGHRMVATGVINKDNKDKLVINDPGHGIIYITFEDFVNGKYGSDGYCTYVFVTTPDNGAAEDYSNFVAGQESKAFTAMANYNDRMHMVYLASTSDDFWHTYYDGIKWSTAAKIPKYQSKAPAVLALYEGKLHLVHQGLTANELWHSSYHNGSWPKATKVPNQYSKATPALIAYDGKLHMVYIGNTSDKFWHTYYDGESWSTATEVPGYKSRTLPSLAVYDGKLHMVHQGYSTNVLWHSWYDGNTWSTAAKIPNHKSKATPAMAANNGKLHMIHQGNSTNDLWYTSYEDNTWGQAQKTGMKSKVSPAMGLLGNKLYMTHLGDNSNHKGDFPDSIRYSFLETE